MSGDNERGHLAFGLISIIATGLLLLATVVKTTLIIGKLYVESLNTRNFINFAADSEILVLLMSYRTFGYIIFALINLVTFGYSVILCDGISQSKAEKIRTYIIFGVTYSLVLITAGVTSFFFGFTITIVACVIYSLILVVLHQIYSKISDKDFCRRHFKKVERENI